MSQRHSGFERKPRDLYETPAWVMDAVVDFIDVSGSIWEPSAGSGKMVSALQRHGFDVYGSDVETGHDFLKAERMPHDRIAAIVTNPPFVHATTFIEHALRLTRPVSGVVAMLLRTDFDHAKTRQHLFGQCDVFQLKLVLTKRIRWFENSTGSPSVNHAWFVWDWKHRGAPALAYAPASTAQTETALG
jgi:hypothetical protein